MSLYLRVRDLASSPGKPGRFPVNQSTIFRWVKKGAFPAPIPLSPGVTAWRISDIEAWEAKHRGVTA